MGKTFQSNNLLCLLSKEIEYISNIKYIYIYILIGLLFILSILICRELLIMMNEIKIKVACNNYKTISSPVYIEKNVLAPTKLAVDMAYS